MKYHHTSKLNQKNQASQMQRYWLLRYETRAHTQNIHGTCGIPSVVWTNRYDCSFVRHNVVQSRLNLRHEVHSHQRGHLFFNHMCLAQCLNGIVLFIDLLVRLNQNIL